MYEFRSLADTDISGCDLEMQGTNSERKGDWDLRRGNPTPYLGEKRICGFGRVGPKGRNWGRTWHPYLSELEAGT